MPVIVKNKKNKIDYNYKNNNNLKKYFKFGDFLKNEDIIKGKLTQNANNYKFILQSVYGDKNYNFIKTIDNKQNYFTTTNKFKFFLKLNNESLNSLMDVLFYYKT
jgi:hypothetical protein